MDEKYERLAVNLSGVSKSGTTDLLYQQGTSASNFNSYSNFTVSNDLSSLPNESFIFAFKYFSFSGTILGNKVKVTPGEVTDTYIDL